MRIRLIVVAVALPCLLATATPCLSGAHFREAAMDESPAVPELPAPIEPKPDPDPDPCVGCAPPPPPDDPVPSPVAPCTPPDADGGCSTGNCCN
jgi:hypothetical protein